MRKCCSDIKNHAFKNLQKMRDFLLDIIFPIECLSCGKEGEWICKKCFRRIKIKTNHYCLFCKKETKIGETCLKCKDKFFIDGVLIAGNYQDKIISKLIKNLKYKFAKGVASHLGELLILGLNNAINKNKIYFFGKNKKITFFDDLNKIIIIPIPLHKKRLNWRGFNQAYEISCVVAGHFKLPISQKLICAKNKKPQAKLNAEKRRKNIEGCFAWTGENLDGKNILLIDDVATTGSTLNECAKVLKEKGADKIWGLVVAHG